MKRLLALLLTVWLLVCLCAVKKAPRPPTDAPTTGYQKFHDYIVKKGKLQKGSYVYTKNVHSIPFTFIMDKDGIMWWELTFNEWTVKLQILEESDVQKVTLLKDGYTCTADIELSTYVKYGDPPTFLHFSDRCTQQSGHRSGGGYRICPC